MIGVLVVTHGAIGEALLASAEPDPRRQARRGWRTLGVSRSDDPDSGPGARARARARSSTTATGVLVLTDMFGATPSNIAARLLAAGASRASRA